ncbi:MAG: sulfatase-like hydrolase/transferase [Opitutaceae bacterium]
MVALVGLLTPAPGKPANVVVIMPDDVSFDDFGFSSVRPGTPRTPELDRFASVSVRLTDFHVSPTCSPTRAALMTGRYSNATGVWHTILGRYLLREGEVTMAEVFKANGYRTALFGKWHLGVSFPFRPQDRGFDRVVGLLGGGIDQQTEHWGNRNTVPCVLYDDGHAVALTEDNGGLPGVEPLPGFPGAFATNFLTTQAIAYMQGCHRDGMPFFAYLPYNVAHDPQDLPLQARRGTDGRTATIENLDHNVGRILEFLDREGLANDTLVVFLTDNGMANGLYRGGKASHYEGGHRVPCLIRWKGGGIGGAPADAREVGTLLAHVDLLPTLMEVLSLHDVPARPSELQLHGRSFAALLDVERGNDDPSFATRSLVVDNQRSDQLLKYKQAAVMRGGVDAAPPRWRLVRDSAETSWRLYDVLTDPRQSTDLADQPSCAGTVRELASAYEAWWTQISAGASLYSRPRLGSVQQPVVCLYAHDWHTDGSVPWNQTLIAAGLEANGVHAVSFDQAGEYVFDLRRWPAEISSETTLVSPLQREIRIYESNALTRGRALSIRTARIRIWREGEILADESSLVDPDADGAIFKLRVPAGPVMLQTWFYDQTGRVLCGAFYVYVEAAGAALLRAQSSVRPN